MTTSERNLRSAYRRTGLALLGFSFERAMAIKAIRITLECAVKANIKGKPAPIQPTLI